MEYIAHLSKDKKLKKLLDTAEPHQLKKRKNICTYLCASIMSQQLSTKVADVIAGKLSSMLAVLPEALRQTVTFDNVLRREHWRSKRQQISLH